MKYLVNYQPYVWNQAENSTQNSSSNLKYVLYDSGVSGNLKYIRSP